MIDSSCLPERDLTVTRSGFRMRLSTAQVIDFKLLVGQGHEPETTKIFKRLVQPGMTAVDIGANIGWMTLQLASLVGRKGRILAFEASDWTYERLTFNVSLNDFPQVSTFHAAVGAEDGCLELRLPRGYRFDGVYTDAAQKVQVVTLVV